MLKATHLCDLNLAVILQQSPCDLHHVARVDSPLLSGESNGH